MDFIGTMILIVGGGFLISYGITWIALKRRGSR